MSTSAPAVNPLPRSNADAVDATINAAVAITASFIVFSYFKFHNVSATFLLLSKWPTPCDYAAKRSPDGAMFKFAFTFCKLEHMSILFQPHQKYTVYTYGGDARYCPAVHIFVINAYHYNYNG